MLNSSRIIPVETVGVGDTISHTTDFKDVKVITRGEVARIYAEGRVRTLYTCEGVELARYVIGKPSFNVILVKAAEEQSTPLEMFA